MYLVFHMCFLWGAFACVFGFALLLWPSFKLNSRALMALVHVILVFLRPNHLEAIILSHSHHRCGLRFDSKLKTLGAFKILGFTSLCFQVFLLYIIVVLGFLVSHYVHHCCLSFEFKCTNVCDSTCMVISLLQFIFTSSLPLNARIGFKFKGFDPH